MTSVAVLLPWSVAKDSRAQRTIRTMARHAEVHVFHSPATADAPSMAPAANVHLHPLPHATTRKEWILRHSLMHREHGWLATAVLATGIPFGVVYAHDLPSAWPALRIARRHRSRILYDVHDLAVETLNQGFPESPPPLKKMKYAVAKTLMRTTSAHFEARFVRRADLVVTTTTSYLDYLKERYGLSQGLVLPNYPERREVVPSDRLRAEARVPPGAPIVLYHGMLGPGRHLKEIVAAAPLLEGGAILVLVGNGPLEKDLQAAADPERVRFLDFVPYDRLLETATAASLGLILIEHINLSKEYALANKLTEYMASGVPVLASDSPENRRVLGDADAGWLLRPAGPASIARRINELLRDREALRAKGANGRRAFLDRYHWEASEPAFERAFLELLKDRP